MKAIILAAGIGKRMQEYSNGSPKCLIPFAGETLLSREIRILKELGFTEKDILVVGGYKYERLKDCGATLIINSKYEQTDNAYSLGLALEQIQNDDVLVMDADLVFEPAILKAIIEDPRPNLVLSKLSADLQESTGIVLRDDGTVSAIGKQYLNSGYVYISIFKFAKEISNDFLDALLKQRSVKTWYTSALTDLMQEYPFYNLSVSGKWHEIDFPEDYIETMELFGVEEAT